MTTPHPPNPSLLPHASPAERQAFDVFRRRFAVHLPGSSWAMSWQKLVLQASLQEPALFHGLCSVGMVYQATRMQPHRGLIPITDRELHASALGQYSRALSLTQQFIQKTTTTGDRHDTEVVLLACLLFVCFEMMSWEEENAAVHIKTGFRILLDRAAALTGSKNSRELVLRSRPSTEFDMLARTFASLDIDMTLFGLEAPQLHLTAGMEIPAAFYNVEEAQVHLDILSSRLHHIRGQALRAAEADLRAKGRLNNVDGDYQYCLVQAYSRTVKLDTAPTVLSDLEDCKRNLVAWMSGLASFREAQDRETRLSHLLIKVQFFFTWLMVCTCRDDEETLVDRFEEQFAHVLGLAEQYVQLIIESNDIQAGQTNQPECFALGAGLLPCVMSIATKSRTSIIRWRAQRLLRRINIRGLLESGALAAFVHRAIELEEESARRITGFAADRNLSCDDVPEEARFLEVTPSGELDKPESTRLVVARRASDPFGPPDIEEHWFDIRPLLA